ncbi:MAG: hypothetical protein HY818_05255 [Acetobacterium woodii]|nr:hypothetical protein [Acetobacterium woodii]
MEEKVKVPFWQKTWVVVLACIFIPPAGIALLWVSKKGGMVLRIILTVILGFYSLAWLSGVFGGGASKTTNQTAAKTEVVAEQKATTETKKEEPVAPTNSPKMNMAEFTAIQNGMTYDEVVAIVGGSGTLSSEVGTKGEPYYTQTYTFEGEGDFGANAILSIQDGALTMKTQYGLK